jgi:hypothetical protein
LRGHEHFEELAALAAVGELSDEEWRGFSEHRENCAACRKAVDSFSGLAAAAFEAGALPDERGRERKQRAETAVFRTIAIAQRAAKAHVRRPVWIGAQAATATILVFAGILVGFHLSRTEAVHVVPITRAVAPPVPKPSASDLQAAKVELERYRQLAAGLQQDASHEAAENSRLRGLLTSTEQKATDLEVAIQSADKRINDQAQELAKNAADLAAARAATQSAATSNTNATIELRYKLAEAEAKLKETTDGLDRERQMLAADREIRDIMGARDVHIVDVFDVDGKGHTKKAFGRAFYTQGKSLIFYAFDLPLPKSGKGEFAYYAWGRNSTVARGPTHRLGIFYNDDRAQQRWTMKFDDPKVLAEIDTVFVTLEPSLRDQTRPTGKPILDAYFGTPPNHP